MKKSSAKIRYGIIGLGHIAQTAMLPAFQHASSNSKLTALISDDPVKLKKLAAKHGIEHTYAYENYEQCLTSGHIDAIYIATPNHTHRVLAEQAAACGIHILCEKPLAVDEASCKSMIASAKSNGVKLMTGYRLHFETANLESIKQARANKLGELKYFSSIFSMQVKNKENIRLGPTVLGGGPLYDIGIYCINTARNLFRDEPYEVVALAGNTGDERFSKVNEMMSVIMRFPKGQLATFTISFGAADVATFDLVGSKSRLRLESAYDYAMPMTLETVKDSKAKKREFRKKDQFAPELIYFSKCILNDVDPEPSGLEGLADVRVIEAVLRSLDERRAIRVNESRPPQKSKWPTVRQKIERPAVNRPPKAIHAKAPSDS